MRKKKGGQPETDGKETKASDEEYDMLDSVGGTRKHKKRAGKKTRRAKK